MVYYNIPTSQYNLLTLTHSYTINSACYLFMGTAPSDNYPIYFLDDPNLSYPNCNDCVNSNVCPSPTPTVTSTLTPTISLTPSLTQTITPSNTLTPTISNTPSQTKTPTPTPSNTPASITTFSMSTMGAPDPSTACFSTVDGTYYHNGLYSYPVINDTVYIDSLGNTPFDSAGQYYLMGNNRVITTNSSGVVQTLDFC